MTVSEAPAVAPTGILPLPTLDRGGGIEFAALLGQDVPPQKYGSPSTSESADQLNAAPQSKRRNKRPDDPNSSGTPASDTPKASLNNQSVQAAMIGMSPLSLDTQSLTATASANTVEPSRPGVVDVPRSSEAQGGTAVGRGPQLPFIASADGRLNVNPPADCEVLQPLASDDGNTVDQSPSDGVPSIDFIGGSKMRDHVEREVQSAGANRAAFSVSATPSSAIASDGGSFGSDSLIRESTHQVTGAQVSKQKADIATTQLPSLAHDQKGALSGSADTSKVTSSDAKTSGSLAKPAVTNGVPGDTDIASAVEAVSSSSESAGGSGHRDLSRGAAMPSSPERASAKSDGTPQPMMSFADPAQSGTGRSPLAQIANRAGGDVSLASATSSTQAAFQHLADANAGRELQAALRSDLKVGVPTEVFGHVTIQTTSTAGQVSAQLSLEDARQSAVLAGHLPVVEQRLMQHLGVDASVRLAAGVSFGGGWGGAGGGQSGGSASQDGRRSPESAKPTVAGSLPSIAGPKEEHTSGSVYGGQMSSSRLDLRV